jgi:DNA modification methylase
MINGDCFEELSKIKSGSISLILTDPPYLISRSSNFQKKSKSIDQFMATKYNMSIDFGEWDKEDIDWDLLFSEYYRVLEKGGTLLVFFDIWKSNLMKFFAEKNKFKQPRICSWIKNNPVPINSKINYLSNSAEYFFSFIKGKNPKFNSEYDNGVYRYPLCHGKERLDHPTQKPISLISDLVLKHSNPGDTILDTFAGTGTVGHSCILHDRNFILIERDIKYFEILKSRLNSLDRSAKS